MLTFTTLTKDQRKSIFPEHTIEGYVHACLRPIEARVHAAVIAGGAKKSEASSASCKARPKRGGKQNGE